MTAFSQTGPATLMHATTAVRIPSGAQANMKLSSQLMLCDKNCLVNCSPNKLNNGPRSENRLLEKSSPSSAAPTAAKNKKAPKAVVAQRKSIFLMAARVLSFASDKRRVCEDGYSRCYMLVY